MLLRRNLVDLVAIVPFYVELVAEGGGGICSHIVLRTPYAMPDTDVRHAATSTYTLSGTLYNRDNVAGGAVGTSVPPVEARQVHGGAESDEENHEG
eukprot:3941596-Rhodomonas_salina.3